MPSFLVFLSQNFFIDFLLFEDISFQDIRVGNLRKITLNNLTFNNLLLGSTEIILSIGVGIGGVDCGFLLDFDIRMCIAIANFPRVLILLETSFRRDLWGIFEVLDQFRWDFGAFVEGEHCFVLAGGSVVKHFNYLLSNC